MIAYVDPGFVIGTGTLCLAVVFSVAAPLSVRHHDKKKAKR